MPASTRLPVPRYRRRILGIGLITAGALYSIGAPIYVNRIEADLERRVPAELAEAGFDGVIAEFSGQDGTLRCAGPLADPELATDAAFAVSGVRAVTLDRSCRVNRAPLVEGDASAADGDPGPISAPEVLNTVAANESATSTEPAFGTVAELIATDPRLSYLSVLVSEAGLASELGDPGAEPVTMFAPTDDAFEALPADVIALLRSDPDLLVAVLARHITPVRVMSGDLFDGALTMLDDETVDVVVADGAITVDGANVIDRDLVAGNGIVHVVDRVIVPEGIDVGAGEVERVAPIAATLADGVVTLTGVVASEAERAKLVAAAVSGAGPDGVVDQLTVDPDRGLDSTTTTSLAGLVAAMAANLVSGESGFDGSALYSRGVYAAETGRAAMSAATEAVGVTAELTQLADTATDDAASLEAALNELVAADPVRFEPTRAVLTADAATVLDAIAARLLGVAGVRITVEGHTDSDGDPAVNLTLSQQRADAVRLALIERGLDGSTISAQGFGSERPVLVAGVEDKDASRRVEFRIETTS